MLVVKKPISESIFWNDTVSAMVLELACPCYRCLIDFANDCFSPAPKRSCCVERSRSLGSIIRALKRVANLSDTLMLYSQNS